MNDEIKEIEAEIAKLERKKEFLIERNKSTEKLVTIHFKFLTTIHGHAKLEASIRRAIRKGFDLTGISEPSEIEFKELKIQE